ncbi:MAG TPA: Ig-like domain-containing protein [Thermoanaerobaculia bacterium]|nr:Ig-like domain-containing protein [Thermoanaerobaculia bacterium]
MRRPRPLQRSLETSTPLSLLRFARLPLPAGERETPLRGSDGTPTGTVSFVDKHGSLGEALLQNGRPSLTVQKRSYHLTLHYLGDSNYLPVSSAEDHFQPRP